MLSNKLLKVILFIIVQLLAVSLPYIKSNIIDFVYLNNTCPSCLTMWNLGLTFISFMLIMSFVADLLGGGYG